VKVEGVVGGSTFARRFKFSAGFFAPFESLQTTGKTRTERQREAPWQIALLIFIFKPGDTLPNVCFLYHPAFFPRKNPRVLGSESLLRVSHFSNARTGDKKKQDAGVASAKIS